LFGVGYQHKGNRAKGKGENEYGLCNLHTCLKNSNESCWNCFKEGRGIFEALRRGLERGIEGMNWSRYNICMHGNITMKLVCSIICGNKNIELKVIPIWIFKNEFEKHQLFILKMLRKIRMKKTT
jgi:hypothetical protein